MKKTFKKLPYIIAIIFWIWIILSFFNVINNNMPWQEHNYWSWNFFEIMSKMM